jgi:hypothetical protein
MLLSKRLAKFKYYLTKYFEIFSNIEKNASSYFDENVEHNMNFPDIVLTYEESRAISCALGASINCSFDQKTSEFYFYRITSEYLSQNIKLKNE